MADGNEDRRFLEEGREMAASLQRLRRIFEEELLEAFEPPNSASAALVGSGAQGNESHGGVQQTPNHSEAPRHGSSTVGTIASPIYGRPVHQGKCIVCLCDFPRSRLEHIPCGHDLCAPCLNRLFQCSLDNEDNSLPSCCHQPIPLTHQAMMWLEPVLIRRYHEKKEGVEADQSEHKRTYCHMPRCSTLLNQRHISENKAACPNCAALTYIVCKERYHDNGECTKKGGLRVPELEDLAEREGWRRCTFCGQMIERIAGCPEMR